MTEVLLNRRVAWWLLATYGVLLLAIVFEPFPHAATGSVSLGYQLVEVVGLGDVVSRGVVAFVLNIVLFVPLAFLGSVVARRTTCEQWVGLGLLSSVAIELLQSLLPERTESVGDVTANTLGALLGALAARHLLRGASPTDVKQPSRAGR